MRDTSPFVLHRHAYVCGDGPELLLYQSSDGEPMWKAFAEGVLVGVGVTDDAVVTVDSDGRLVSWKLVTGARLEEVDLGVRALGLVVHPAGSYAVLGQHEVVVGGRWGQNRVPLDDGSAMAFGHEGEALGLGTQHGRFYAVEPKGGAAWGSVDVGAPVDGIGWSAQGYWVVAAGGALLKVAADASGVLASVDLGFRGARLAVSGDGLLAAVCAGSRDIRVYELHDDGRIATIAYTSREVSALCFAEGGLLGVGLDDGDANRFALLTGEVGRTGQHRGRVFSQWRTEVDIDPGRVRGAMARVTLGADGGPIAQQVVRDKKGKAVDPDKVPNRKRTCLVTCLTVVLTLVVCSGCSGLGYMAWIKIYYG